MILFCSLYVNSVSCLLIFLRAFGQQHWPMKRSLTEHSKLVFAANFVQFITFYHSVLFLSWDMQNHNLFLSFSFCFFFHLTQSYNLFCKVLVCFLLTSLCHSCSNNNTNNYYCCRNHMYLLSILILVNNRPT